MTRKKYLSVVYDEQRKPLTGYPERFAGYLASRYGITPARRLLDAGCGRAELLNAFVAMGMECRGCDLEAPQGGAMCRVDEVDFTRNPLPYEDGAFDVAISKSVIEHLADPRLYLSEVRRVLAPGGRLVLLTPDWRSQMKVFYEDPTHVHPYLPRGVGDLLRLHGFVDVAVERFSHHEAIWGSRLGAGAAGLLRGLIDTPTARRLTDLTGVKFFRWAVELQVLASGTKSAG
jgi:SAM-dependent methyltransferase